MDIAGFVRRKSSVSGLNALPPPLRIATVAIFFLGGALFDFNGPVFGDEIKKPNVAGQFYPAGKDELNLKVENLLKAVNPEYFKGGTNDGVCRRARGYGRQFCDTCI